MDLDEKIQYWLEIALDDLDSAKIMLNKKKYLQSGFYCHQSIEKAMKSYFCYYRKTDPPYTHNLLKLSEETGLNDTLSDEWKNHIDLLMPLNIEARYPDEKKEIMKRLDAARTKEIYKKTKELLRWIRTSMKK